MVVFGGRNGLYHALKWALSQCDSDSFGAVYDACNDGVLFKWLIIRLLAYPLIYGLYAAKKYFVENIRFLSGVEYRYFAILVHYNQLSGQPLRGS